jgi:hypothetical protein
MHPSQNFCTFYFDEQTLLRRLVRIFYPIVAPDY